MLVVGGLVFMSASVWAFRPLRGVAAEVPPIRTDQPNGDQPGPSHPEFDQSVFAKANLWHVPPSSAQQEIAQASAPARPLNVQLIGIINEAGTRRAAVYDSESDRLLIVSHGDRVRGDYLVTSITDSGIELTSGRSVHVLKLEGDSS